MKKMSLKLFIAGASVVAFGCASHKTNTEVVQEARTTTEVEAASQLNRSWVSTIAFEPGQKGLSASATSEIQRVLADARKMGEIKTVEVAVWSDQEYPVKGKVLSKRQINLADERAKNVERLIDQVQPASNVKTFNMAKQPNAFQKWVDTRDAHVKAKLASAGVTSQYIEGQKNERASSALLFIEIK